MVVLLRSVLEIVKEFYRIPLQIFLNEKEPERYFSYKGFLIKGFRGLDDVSLSFSRNDLILLLGLNESGKTSILRAIESFDFNNDPDATSLKSFFTSIRNKQDIDCSTPCQISADIHFDRDLDYQLFKKVLKEAGFEADVKAEIESFTSELNKSHTVRVTRVIPFTNGNPGASFYQFENQRPFSQPKLGNILAQEIVRRCPFIFYFEDFQDAIPARIHTGTRNGAYNETWYAIIDGLFFNTDPTYSIKKFEGYFSAKNPREDDARSVLNRVNKTLQTTFTEKWKNLSGVQDIEKAEITYNTSKKYFEIKVSERDGTTFSVAERSKGAVWYLAFLMKTEFRRKKLREGSGKPIYLIDEPASNLHSTAQQKMVQDFTTLVEDTSVVYTTHSRYLISIPNVKNTYVVKRDNGKVSCTKWSDYIKGKDAKISYYQPLYDCLNIVPNSSDIPWDHAVITEGPSDALVLEMMQNIIGLSVTHVIYPGTSATDLSTLISLNLGWGAKFRVLLDADIEGQKQRARYKKLFGLDDEIFVLLPGDDTKIEGMFTDQEKIGLGKLAYGEQTGVPSKDEFLAIMRAISAKPSEITKTVTPVLSPDTIQRFKVLFQALGVAE